MGMTALQSAIRMLPCMIAGTIAAVCLSRLARRELMCREVSCGSDLGLKLLF
jgi:hypothetical protein